MDWDAWGRAKRCAVLLLAHPPKSGAGYAGSTDWEAATRSLWTLAKEKRGNAPPGRGIDNRAEEWKLELEKANYSVTKPVLHMAWDNTGGGARWRIVGKWDANARYNGPVDRQEELPNDPSSAF